MLSTILLIQSPDFYDVIQPATYVTVTIKNGICKNEKTIYYFYTRNGLFLLFPGKSVQPCFQ